jgi:transposase-like protein
MVSQVILCPHCQQAKDVVKFGKSTFQTQRYQCKICNKTFATEPKSKSVSPEKETLIEGLLAERISYRGIKRAAKVGYATIQRIAKKNNCKAV